MRVLITGANGYIGSLLLSTLKNKYEIYGFDCFNSPINDCFYGNLDYKNSLIRVFNQYKPDCVVHLAAIASINDKYSLDNYLSTNLKGTSNLLEVMNSFGVKKIIFASSCCIYGNSQKPANELDNPKSESFYGLSKLMGEELIKFYHNNYEFNYTILRISNVIGGDGKSESFKNRLIPMIFDKISKDESIEVSLMSHKSNTCIRDYVDISYLFDVISFFIENNINETFNIASGKSYSIDKIIRICSKISGVNIPVIYKEKRIGDVDATFCDNKKMTNLGFPYKITIEDSISEIYERG